MLHIHYLMTCSEYDVLDCHTDIYLAMIAYGKCLNKLVYQKMENNLLEIALSGQYTTYLFGWHDDFIGTSEHCVWLF